MAAVSRTRDEVERLWWLTGVLLLVLHGGGRRRARTPDQRRVRRCRRPHRRQRRGAPHRRRRRPGAGRLGRLRRLARQPRRARLDAPLRHLRADLRPGGPGRPTRTSVGAGSLERTTALAQRVLDALAVELTGARTVKEVADGFVGHAVGTLGATSAMVLSLDADDVLRTVTWHGRSGDGADQFQEIPLDQRPPGRGRGARGHRRALPVRGRRSWPPFPTWPGTTPPTGASTCCRCAATARRTACWRSPSPRTSFTAAEDGFLHSLAGALTSAVVRAEELQDADAATQRTALLAEASMTPVAQPRPGDHRRGGRSAPRAPVRRLVRRSSCCATVSSRPLAVQHRDPETTEWARTLHRRLPDPHGRPHRCAERRPHRAQRDLPVHPRRARRGDRRQRRAPGDPAAPGVHQRDRRTADRVATASSAR